MRLINRHNFAMGEFHGDAIPPYYILSHTWTTEEASFAMMQRTEIQHLLTAMILNESAEHLSNFLSLGLPGTLTAEEAHTLWEAFYGMMMERNSETLVRTTAQWAHDLDNVIQFFDRSDKKHNFPWTSTVCRRYRGEMLAALENLSKEYASLKTLGYQKVKEMAKLGDAQSLGWGEECEWFWIDTCCIDKTNSAELAEALNSMSTYYANAIHCIAYMADVTAASTFSALERTGQFYEFWEFETSHWFTRGWTLQELLFPTKVVFFNRHWKRIGYRDSPPTAKVIERATGIPLVLLNRPDKESLQRTFARHDFPVAQKISWAAQRRTTRAEDAAYCLLGIFGVNMPLVYGEGGAKAFRRLQEQIIRSGGGDGSLFIWRDPLGTDGIYSGLLANSPSHFERDLEDVLELPEIMSFAEDDYAEMGNGCILLNVKMLPITGITAEMRLESASTSQAEDTLVTLDHREDVFVPIIPGLQNPHGTYTSILLRKDRPNGNMYTRIYPAWIVTFGQAAMRASFARGASFVKARIRDEPILPRNDDNISLYGMHIKTGALRSYNTERHPILRPSEGHIVPVRHYGDICQATYGLIDLPCTNGRHRLTLTYHGNTLPEDTSSWKTTLNAPGKLVVRTELLPKDLDELPNTHGKIHLPLEYGSVADVAGSSSGAVEEVRECPDCRVYISDYDVSLWENQAVLTIHSLEYEFQDHRISLGRGYGHGLPPALTTSRPPAPYTLRKTEDFIISHLGQIGTSRR